MGVLVILLAAFTAAPPAAESNAKTGGAPARTRVIDPTYVPQMGDQAFVDTGQKDEEGDPYAVPAAVSIQELITYLQLQNARNEGALDKMEDAKKVNLLDAGTEVMITAISPIPLAQIRAPQGVLKAGPVCAELKVLSGEFKGQVLYAFAHEVVRYANVPSAADVPAPRSRPAKRTKKGKAPATEASSAPQKPAADPGARAESLLKLGQSLEKAGKTAGAIDFYRQLVKQFPNTKQAKVAAARIKSLQHD